LARTICNLPDTARQFPSYIHRLFDVISANQGLKKASQKTT